MYDPFNSNRILADTEKNHVIAHSGQPRFRAEFWP